MGKRRVVKLTEDDIKMEAAVENLKEIYQLKLSRKRLSAIDSVLYKCINLKSLDISFNNISSIKGLSQLKSLKHLSIAGNNISDINEITKMKYLISLYANNNQITSLNGLGCLQYLQSVWVQNNEIEIIEHGDLPVSTTSLDISNNPLQDFRGVSSLNRLNDLSLAELNLSKLPTFRWAALSQLEELNLNNNQLSDILVLSSLNKLSILHMDENNMSNIALIPQFSNLTELYLTENKLNSIVGLDRKCPNLDVLDLENNIISTKEFNLTIQTLCSFKKLETLHLKGNPIAGHPRYKGSIVQLVKSLYYLDGQAIHTSTEEKIDHKNSNTNVTMKRNNLMTLVEFIDSIEHKKIVENMRKDHKRPSSSLSSTSNKNNRYRSMVRPQSTKPFSIPPSKLRATVKDCRARLEAHRKIVQKALDETRALSNNVILVSKLVRSQSGTVYKQPRRRLRAATPTDSQMTNSRPHTPQSTVSSQMTNELGFGRSTSSIKLYTESQDTANNEMVSKLRRLNSGDLFVKPSNSTQKRPQTANLQQYAVMRRFNLNSRNKK